MIDVTVLMDPDDIAGKTTFVPFTTTDLRLWLMERGFDVGNVRFVNREAPK